MENENQTEILNSNLVINVTGCAENNLQSNVAAVIEGIKGAMGGVPINLQINLYTQDGILHIQNLSNSNGDESNYGTIN